MSDVVQSKYGNYTPVIEVHVVCHVRVHVLAMRYFKLWSMLCKLKSIFKFMLRYASLMILMFMIISGVPFMFCLGKLMTLWFMLPVVHIQVIISCFVYFMLMLLCHDCSKYSWWPEWIISRQVIMLTQVVIISRQVFMLTRWS